MTPAAYGFKIHRMNLQQHLERLGSLSEIRSIDWLRYVGVLVWFLTALTLLLLPWMLPEAPATGDIVGWWSAALLFMLVLWHPVIGRQRSAPFWKRVLLML